MLTAARSYHRSLRGDDPTVFFSVVDFETCPAGFQAVRTT